MAVTSTPFNRVRHAIASGKVNLNTDAVKAVLVPVGFVQNVDTQGVLADLTAGNAPIAANLVSAAVTLAGQTLTEDDATDRARFSSNTVEFEASGAVSAIGAVLYDDTVASAPDADLLLTYIAFGETKTLAAGEKLQIPCPATGWLAV